MRGMILFAHGARDPGWAAPLEASLRRTQALLPQWRVSLAFLEFMSPDLAACGQAMVEAGCTEVEVLPLFLGAGGHVRRDLPAQVQALGLAHPQVIWRLNPAVGESARLIEAMAQAALDLALDAARGEKLA